MVENKIKIEEEIEQACYDKVRQDDITRQRVCEVLNISQQEYLDYLRLFQQECLAKYKRHTSITDYYRHSYDWIRIHVKMIKKEQQGRRLTPKEEWLKYEEERRKRLIEKWDGKPTDTSSDTEPLF